MRYAYHQTHGRGPGQAHETAPGGVHDDAAGRAPATQRRCPHRVAYWIIAVKLVIVAAIIALPSGLVIGLGAAHGFGLAIAAVIAGALLILRRHRAARRRRSPDPTAREDGGR